tara:strand:+ start:351 stop:521 length:171 start_codon:yes stop_codon:yes gene_type:complete
MDMARKKTALNCYIDPFLADRLDAWIKAQPYGASKTAVVEKLLSDFLEQQEAGQSK